MKIKVHISCCLCSECCDVEIQSPKGWKLAEDKIYSESMFCPKHAEISQWVETQCADCYGEWGHCLLWTRLREQRLEPQEYASMRAGYCPCLDDPPAKERAPVKSGKALATAIEQHYLNYDGIRLGL